MKKDLKFSTWLMNFRKTQLWRYNDIFLDSIFSDITVLPCVLERDRKQSEITLSVADYTNRLCSEDSFVKGKASHAKWSKVLDQIEENFGVPATVLLALWGVETSYGSIRGDIPTLSALATLAFDGRRQQFFEQELCAAVEILHNFQNPAQVLIGSWAGAMGHTQFMPSTYLKYAIDFYGKGWVDIWSDNPIDALASSASYLSSHGWNLSLPWGRVVTLPHHFDFALTAPNVVRTISEFLDMGLDGLPREPGVLGSVFLPMGASGPAFWISNNFSVLKQYNKSASYALSIGLLSDGFNTGAMRHLNWPSITKALSRGDMKKLQSRLTDQGFDTKGCDGVFGPNTEIAIRGFQSKNALVEDGYPSHDLLNLVCHKLT
tara:strand:+ start:617 stop:1744 length:1128 start_codon:yes stop_codon:yes gene_type:complete